MFALAATLLFGASTVSAISSSCTTYITSLALSDDGDCINIAGLVPFATLSSDASIIPPIDSWVEGLCSQTTTCSNDTLAAIGNNITSSCSTDLEGLGLTSTIIDEIPSLLQQYYGVANEALCTRNTNTSDAFCVSQELTILQNSIGENLTTSNVVSAAVGVLSNTTLESELACTTCVQGIYAIVRPQIGSTYQTELDGTLNDVCGSGFVTTTEPSGIIVATGSLASQTATSTSSSGAARRGFSNPLSSSGAGGLGMAGLGMMIGGVYVVLGL